MYSTFHSTPFGHGPSHQQHIDIESINGDSQEQCSLNNFAVAGTKDFLNLSEEHLGVTGLSLKELFSLLKALNIG